MKGSRFVVLGAGGHAKVVIASIEAAGGTVACVLDDDPARHGSRVLGHAVVGPVANDLVPSDCLAVVAIGANRPRAEMAARLSTRFGIVVHPSSVVHPTVTLGEGTVVFAGSVLQPGARVGRHVIVNTSASVDHDCVLGDFSHIAPGVHLAGAAHLGRGVLMGIGSCAVPGSQVGDWATVGAGACVVGAVSAGATVVGVPAKSIARR